MLLPKRIIKSLNPPIHKPIVDFDFFTFQDEMEMEKEKAAAVAFLESRYAACAQECYEKLKTHLETEVPLKYFIEEPSSRQWPSYHGNFVDAVGITDFAEQYGLAITSTHFPRCGTDEPIRVLVRMRIPQVDVTK